MNFTVRQNPFTGILLTDLNTVYVDADTGDDYNPGTSASPKKTLNVLLTAALPNCVARGVFTDNYTVKVAGGCSGYLLGDLNTVVDGLITFEDASTTTGDSSLYINGIKISQVINNYYQSLYPNGWLFLSKCEVVSLSASGSNSRIYINDSIVENIIAWRSSPTVSANIRNVFRNFRTVAGALAANSDWYPIISDAIFTDNIHICLLGQAYPQFIINNSIIRKQCQWYYNSIHIPVTWNAGGDELTDLQTSLLAFADTASVAPGVKDGYRSVVNAIFGAGNMVYDDSSPNIRLFNKYAPGGEISDYSLNMQEGNPALTKSVNLGRIGALPPKTDTVFNAPAEITDAGAVTGNAGDLLVENDGIFINLTSLQQRNKMETDVISLLPGDVFSKWQSLFSQSTSADVYLGAKQMLLPGQHPINGIVVTPYDTPAALSAFPKFIAPLNSPVEIAYAAGSPVTFNDLAGLGVAVNKNLAECGDWAVSNACHEWLPLVSLPGMTTGRPKFRHFKLALIANNFA